VAETRALPAAKLSVFHEKARSPEARATAGLWSVWADAHDFEFEFEFEFKFKFKRFEGLKGAAAPLSTLLLCWRRTRRITHCISRNHRRHHDLIISFLQGFGAHLRFAFRLDQ